MPSRLPAGRRRYGLYSFQPVTLYFSHRQFMLHSLLDFLMLGRA